MSVNILTPVLRCLLGILLSTIALSTTVFAHSQVPALTRVSIACLMTIQITSASRKEQRAVASTQVPRSADTQLVRRF